MNERESEQPAAYPLATLERLRREIRERREQELSAALQMLEDAERELAEHRMALREAERSLDEERGRLASAPGSRAADLQRGHRYLERLAAFCEDRRGACREAEVERGRRTEARSRAQAALALAQAELGALEKHHRGWDRARRELEERRAEQELEDLVAARRR